MASRGRFRQRLLGNRYFLLSEVGSGGMGIVYRARDRFQDKFVAIKLLHPHLRRDPAFVQRFRREADLAMRLDSRHIVQVIGLGKDGDDEYLVMELVEGADLTDIIHGRGPLPESTAASYAIQIARALEEAHAKGIVHRDIKPRNILVQADGIIKVADFGIARVQDTDASRSTDEMGAAPYMDPARFNPNLYGRLDGRTDIYSLGVVLYEMLAGRPPFAGDTYELLNKILHTEPESLAVLRPDVSPELVAITHACLAKDPAQRPASAFEVRSAIAHLADDYPDTAKPRSRAGRLMRRFLAPLRAVFRPRLRHNRGVKALVTTTIAAAFLGISLLFGLFVVQPLVSDDSREASGLDVIRQPGPTVVATVAPPVPCFRGGSVPVAEVLNQCSGAQFAYADNCARGMVCGVRIDDPVAPLLLTNDRTIAFVDNTGNISIARENSSSVRRLTRSGQALQPSWSPDGRFIAYVQLASVKQAGSAEASPATHLRIVDVENPQDDRIVLISSAADPVADFRRLVAWPRWSADGKSLLFLWPAVGDQGDVIYSVELPLQGAMLDMAKLPKDPPQEGYYVATKLSRLGLSAGDFGYTGGYISEFTSRANGEILAVFCESKQANQRCGLGEWDGSKARVITPQPDASFVLSGPAAVSESRVLAYVFAPNDDRLSQFDLESGAETRLRRLDRRSMTLTTSSSSPFASSPDGKHVLIETATSPRTLSLVPAGEGEGMFWSEGHSPVWYIAGRQATSTLALQSSPVSTPPTPGATPSTAPPPVVPMAVNVTVRRQAVVVSGAQVSSIVDGQECATGTTADNGFLRLTTPAPNRPSACSQVGAIVSFRVNGNPVENRVVFSPYAQASAEIILP